MQTVRLASSQTGGRPCTVHIGSMVEHGRCRWNTTAAQLDVPAGILRRLGLQEGERIGAWASPDGRHIHLGPVVGILLGNAAWSLLNGEWASRYRTLQREARFAGVLPLFFTRSGLDSAPRLVAGWTDRSGVWLPTALPLPDVIYNRATYQDRSERKAVSATLRDLCIRHGVTLLNARGAYGKSAVMESLRFFPETAGLAPETIPFSDDAALLDMLRRHPSVFLKAEHGSHGADVLRVTGGTDGWRVKGRCRNREVEERFDHPEQAAHFLSRMTGCKGWVAQQGILLPELDGRVCDVRTIAQKDGRAKWQVPVVIVRRAAPGGVAANMALGGEPFSPEEFLEAAGDRYPALAGLREAAIEATMRLAVALEARFGRLGEIGVDIGVDPSGRPWILEANGKPLHPRTPGVEGRLEHYPFEYAAFLAARSWAGRYSGMDRPKSLEP